jgi:polysaccharide biosynthesis/export protein VpsN
MLRNGDRLSLTGFIFALVGLFHFGVVLAQGAASAGALQQTRQSSVVAGSTPSGAGDSLSSYKLGVGDVINVQVVGEDDLKREKVRLSDAGTLSFPYLGEIKVRGMTVGELEEHITKGLKGRYLLNPQVTVTISEYRNFFVNGQVDKPGGYPYTPGLTVRKAISIAGGFKERASKERINVIHEDDVKGNSKRISLDAPVKPGDIITVEESFF